MSKIVRFVKMRGQIFNRICLYPVQVDGDKEAPQGGQHQLDAMVHAQLDGQSHLPAVHAHAAPHRLPAAAEDRPAHRHGLLRLCLVDPLRHRVLRLPSLLRRGRNQSQRGGTYSSTITFTRFYFIIILWFANAIDKIIPPINSCNRVREIYGSAVYLINHDHDS